MSNITTYDPDFWGSLDQSEFAIPHVSIGQMQTDESKGKPGHFNYNNGRSVTELKQVKLLRVMKTRVLYGRNRNSPARCSSDDFFVPAQRIANPVSASCLNCVAAAWGDDMPLKVQLMKELGKPLDRKPLCAETYNLLMADENNHPFYIKFQKSALKVVQEKLFSRLRFGFPRTAPYLVKFDLLLSKVQGSQGFYYVPLFDNFSELPIEEQAPAAAAYQAYAANAHVHLAREHEEMDAQKAPEEDLPF